MADDPPRETYLAPAIRRKRISSIWIVPIVTALLGIWVIAEHFADRGRQIMVRFETATPWSRSRPSPIPRGRRARLQNRIVYADLAVLLLVTAFAVIRLISP